MNLSEAAEADSQADSQAAAPEHTYDSLFPALPMGSTKQARPAATTNAAPMVKVGSSRITQVRMTLTNSDGLNDRTIQDRGLSSVVLFGLTSLSLDCGPYSWHVTM